MWSWGYDGGRRWPKVLGELCSAADREILGIFELGIVALCFREMNLFSGRKNRDWERWEMSCPVGGYCSKMGTGGHGGLAAGRGKNGNVH